MAAVDCIRRENCAQFVPPDFDAVGATYSTAPNYAFMGCYCDLDVTDPNYFNRCANPAEYVAGKCAREIQEAAERDPQEGAAAVFSGLTGAGKPFGVANLLLQGCDKILCTEECYPEASEGAVATIDDDILYLPNAAGESSLGNLIADAYRAATGTAFALVNIAVMGSPYAPYGLIFKSAPGRPADEDGRVLESEVRHMLFGMDALSSATNVSGGGNLVTLQVTGQQIYDLLSTAPLLGTVPLKIYGFEVSGLTYSWDGSAPVASRVTEVLKDGAPIDKAATYAVTVNDYTAAILPESYKTGMTTTDKVPSKSVVDYLKAQPQPVVPPELDRVTRVN
jgi:hypothetical protein